MYLKNLRHRNFHGIKVGDFISIGRHQDNHIVLQELDIEDRHMRIERKGDGYLVRDLKSYSGTFLNGVRVLEGYLKEGDLLKVGSTEFLFEKSEGEDFSDYLKSKNERWNEELQKIPRFALSDLPVLILGPSGSGKEVLSQLLHKMSHRKQGPVITVNCSALTENLAESELFGHMKGSFTGATQDRKGAFEAAKNGTLILDEVGDLPINLQPKLLRALENKEIKPVGLDRVIPTNVRIVACTHQDLERKIEREEFRLDLFYRLNVIQVQVPPLCNRMEDFEKFLFQFAKEVRVKFLFDAIEIMKGFIWPGNIRELRNLVHRARAVYGAEPINGDRALSLIQNQSAPVRTLSSIMLEENKIGRTNVIREIEKKLIQERLMVNNGNQRKTAIDLGIPKSTLHDRIKKYKINVRELLDKRWEHFRVSKVEF